MIGVANELASLVRGSPACTACVLAPRRARSCRSSATLCLEQLDLFGVALDAVVHLTEIGSDLHRTIGVCRPHALDLPEMVGGFLIGELETVGRRNDHHTLTRTDDFAFDELAQRRQGDGGMRAVEHAGAIGARALV